MMNVRWQVMYLMLLCLVQCTDVFAQRLAKDAVPFVGAQVFIEPGQTSTQIDGWFRTMAENDMTMCRIRMFESYMKQSDGSWDFSLFDMAFQSAARHGVKVYATLFPATEKTDIGGWKFPANDEQKASFVSFIKALVTHYKEFPALAGWVIINEPGTDGNYPRTEFAEKARTQWNKLHPECDYKENGFPVLMTVRNQQFIQDFTTDFLKYIALEIKKYDDTHDVHVNPAGVFVNYGEYNFPVWRDFLSSLGGSAHPSWHFGYFSRRQYSLAMLALSELLRSGAGTLPWFMTEIQGGNNTYSGVQALCPTADEITQWLWTVLGCEGKGSIFWMLNARSSGIEAGEWAMIDFQGKPSERLQAAKQVSEVVNRHSALFRSPRIIPSGIDVVYLKESLWAENLMGRKQDKYQGRMHGAVIKSPIACFKALTERGLNVGLKAIDEYDFSQADHTGRSIILSNQIAIPTFYKQRLEHFVAQGGTLFVEGLTAFFDEELHNTMNTGFTFEKLFGCNISEFILQDNLFTITIGEYVLPTHLWQGKICGETLPVHTHSFGRGKVVWCPSNIALGAWVSDNYKPLSDYLYELLPKSADAIAFSSYQSDVLLRTLKSGNATLLVCINKSTEIRKIVLSGPQCLLSARCLPIYASAGCSAEGGVLTMTPEGVLVLKW
ncbi:hypothetical protein [Bacteroides sp.]|uniref:hypothetical protein n=1 Tax=Bacteroides sp. TaxID=29523 RepID=UPI0026197FC0|nr:hypothetical protein [Bacteroides sp.]